MKTMSCAFVAAALAVGLVTVSFAEEDFSTAVEATPRLGVGNFLAKARAGQPVTVAYFGGSITAQGSDVTKKGGWRVKTTQWLREKFPQTRVTEVNAAIGGTGSGLGVYRYGHDVLVHNPDLVFVEFACNDGGDGCNVKETLRNFEGIVRQTWKKNPRTDIVFAYTITEAMRERYLTGKRPRAAQTDECVAANYGIPTVDFGPRVAKLVAENKLIIDPKAVMPTAVPKGDPKFDQALREAMKNEKRILFANDGVHPRDEGHDLYLASVQALFAAMEDLPAVDHAPALAKLMTADNRENAKMVPISSAITVGDSCRALDAKDGLQRSFGHRAGQLWRISKPGDGIRFKFRGTSCQIYDLLGPNCGQVWITVDGKRCARPVPRFDSYCTYHRLASLSVYEGADGEHSVEITVDANQPDRRSVAFRLKNPEKELASPKYNGTDWYLGQVMLVGEMVEEPVALWPSPLTEMRAQPSSKIAMLPDGAVAVTTGTKYEWPGVRMDFVNGRSTCRVTARSRSSSRTRPTARCRFACRSSPRRCRGSPPAATSRCRPTPPARSPPTCR